MNTGSKRNALLGSVLLLALVAVQGCGSDDPTSPPTVGTITATTATSGEDIDPDGYNVSIGGSGQAIAATGSVLFSNVAPGSQTVTLTGLASNCQVSGNNPLTVTVTAGQNTTATFTVTCTSLKLRLRMRLMRS